MTIQDSISGFFWQGEQGSGSLASALPFPGSLLSPFSSRRVHIHTFPDTDNHTVLTHVPSLTFRGTQPSSALYRLTLHPHFFAHRLQHLLTASLQTETSGSAFLSYPCWEHAGWAPTLPRVG